MLLNSYDTKIKLLEVKCSYKSNVWSYKPKYKHVRYKLSSSANI